MDKIKLYNKLLKINYTPLKYPFNLNIDDNIEFTKNELQLHYIKKYNICIDHDKYKKKIGKNEKSKIVVFL